MVIYTAVPTSGLSAQSALDFASFLRFVGGPAQTPGPGVGQLPDGYLPMTAANGLGALANYTEGVAADVSSQNGYVPLVTSTQYTPPTPPTTTTTTPPTTTTTVVKFGSTLRFNVVNVGPGLIVSLLVAVLIIFVTLFSRRRRIAS